MNTEQITSLAEAKYQAALTLIKEHVGESYHKIAVHDWLAILHRFYMSLPPGSNVKDDIILALEQIKCEDDFSHFIQLQESFITIYLSSPDMSSPDVPFFKLLTLNPYKSANILSTIYSLYDLFGNKISDIILLLASPGSYTIGSTSLDNDGKLLQATFLLNRLQNYYASSKTAIRTIQSSINTCSFMPTSGDLHNYGKSPLIFEFEQKKYIYKPRDMSVDSLIADCMCAFQNLLSNELADLKWGISTPIQWDRNLWLVPFEAKADNLTPTAASKYFGQLGALLCFAKLFGIRDLHGENIMATAQGPVIIDAECAFNKNTITAKGFGETEFLDSLTAFLGSPNQNATFTVSGSPIRLSEFRQPFFDGFQKICQILSLNQSEVQKIYQTSMTKPFSCRWVPIPTAELYTDMYAYNLSIDQRRDIRSYTFVPDKIEKTFGISIDNRCRQSIVKRLQIDFFNGDIPIFSILHPAKGQCYLQMDGHSVLKFPSTPFASLDEFSQNLQWLSHFSSSAQGNAKAQADAELASLFGNIFS